MTSEAPGLKGRTMPALPVFVAMMAALMALTAFAIDILLPAFPEVRETFDLQGSNRQQLIITFYMLGFATGQIAYGPLSDRFGRRPILLTGLAFFAVATLVCIFAETFNLLLAGRFLQGMACAAPRVIVVAVVRDVYGGRRMAEVMSFVLMVFIFIPAVAPLIGTGILAFGDWRLIFWMMMIFAIALLVWMALRLPETRPEDERKPLSPGWIGTAMKTAATTRVTLGYTLATGVIFGGLMGYINSAQQVFQETYGAIEAFPVLFGLIAMSVVASAYVNSRLVNKLGMRRVAHTATLIFTGTTLFHLVLTLFLGSLPLSIFVVLVSVSFFFFGLVMPNFNAICMEPMGEIAGTASSFVGSVTTAMSAIIGWIIGAAFDGTALPMLGGFFLTGALCTAAVLITERGQLFHVGAGE